MEEVVVSAFSPGKLSSRGQNVTRGLVVLWCQRGHDHVMAPEQARRLRHELCCWCRAPIVTIDLSHIASWDRAAVETLIA